MPVNILQPENVKKETISELAHRHMFDPNHMTTDEELANAMVEFSHVSDGNNGLFEKNYDPLMPGEPVLPAQNHNVQVPNPYAVLRK